MRGRCQDDAGTLPGRWWDTARKMRGRCQNDTGTLPGRCQDDAGTLPGRWWGTARTMRGRCKDDSGTLPGRSCDTARTMSLKKQEIILETRLFGGVTGPSSPCPDRRAAATPSNVRVWRAALPGSPDPDLAAGGRRVECSGPSPRKWCISNMIYNQNLSKSGSGGRRVACSGPPPSKMVRF